LEKLYEQDSGRWALVKVDTDRNQEVALRYGIRGIPNVKLFIDGEVVNEFTGALPERMVRQWLNTALPDPFRRELERARSLLGKGETEEGVSVLEKVLREDQNHEEARVLLARQILPQDAARAVELTEGIDADSRQYPLADAIRTIRHLRERQENPEGLPEGAAKLLYLDALRKLAAGDFDAAIRGFIDVIRNDRFYDDDGARRACVALFILLGEENETTRKYRREFSGALNS
jgi:putative thioredoxin